MDTAASNIMESSAGEGLPYLPQEMRLEILAQTLRFTNGIHSDRWPLLHKARVEKWLSIPGFGSMVPEALFMYNKLILKPGLKLFSEQYQNGQEHYYHDFHLTYPGLLMAHHVKDLELVLNCPAWSHDYAETAADVYFAWLQKLANKELGFDQLKTFKITVLLKEFRDLIKLVGILEERFGAMEFPCKDFQLEVLVSDDAAGNPESSVARAMLNPFFSATG
ncbi:hypothetical protein P171DRAFT_480856 [Karstenula rhodostoma CBS 690.94]|uniref:Uncharacterized protein n=1 Tax=Karstenula rhodostoma CBS 690.94 TaxID=1392251 RepID=A0A9P4UH50_9PLEO|nr:hypothetical protein P171DRAFT_480856 [Karstenula rhodostoma CBS 690.94]